MTTRNPATILAGAKPDADPGLHGVAPPLWASDTFRWATAEEKPAYDYGRTVNPNRDMLVAVLAELEGAAGGAITGSGIHRSAAFVRSRSRSGTSKESAVLGAAGRRAVTRTVGRPPRPVSCQSPAGIGLTRATGARAA